MNSEASAWTEGIKKHFRYFKLFQKKPHRFKVTFCIDDHCFNDNIAGDMKYTSKRIVLLVFDEAIFCAALFLITIFSVQIWMYSWNAGRKSISDHQNSS